jgi:hopene-associated glycosyltransferase HpnB
VITAAIAYATLAAWLYLLVARDGFWLASERDDNENPPLQRWPRVVAVVPARDEADVIARSIGSLLRQDYPGDYRIILVDDESGDETGWMARGEGERQDSARLTVIPGKPRPAGWTGKLWALAQGIEQAGETDYLWLTDADIGHAPDNLRRLVARSEADRLVLHSLMVRLRCDTLAEQALIPAFVLFFQMLYPFRRVNRPRTKLGAAAGGCMLVSAPALARAGGIAAIADALIDDCALGAAMKRQGPIRLALTRQAESLRSYGGWRGICAMIARSAYAQLRYSPAILAGTLLALALLFLAPPLLAIFAYDDAQVIGIVTWTLMAIIAQPMLAHYRVSPLWGVAMPAIGTAYGAATLISAIEHWRGRGGLWKGRVQAALGARR